ncbi:MAG: DUF4330 family protein [Clostridiales bacterium]|nr:DUF4330 family protein [Clostridiales bacterium]
MTANKQTGKHKFNVVDAIIIVLILAIVAVGAFIFVRKGIGGSEETFDIEYVLEFRNVRDEFLGNFKVGAKVLDSSKKYQLGEIISVTSEPTTFTGTNTIEGKLVYHDYPEHSDISVTVKAKVTISDENRYMIDNGYRISVGSLVYVRMPDYIGAAYCTNFKITEGK